MAMGNICEIYSPKQRKAIIKFLDALKSSLKACPVDSGTATTKRKPSEYNLFIKQCATSTEKGGQGKPFKTCVEDWRNKKSGRATD